MRLPELHYDSPRKFRRKQRILLATLPPAITLGLKSILLTARLEVRAQEKYDQLHEEGGGVVGFWHEGVVFAAHQYRNLNWHTLTSYSFDGELAARIVSRFGLEAVRGSSSRGGGDALIQLQKAMDLIGGVGFTLDGPTGPRRESKAGAAILAARSRRKILPQAYAASPIWRLNSWDKFVVPKPFCRILTKYGDPIDPPKDESREAIEVTRKAVQDQLNTLQAELEEEIGDTSFTPKEA